MWRAQVVTTQHGISSSRHTRGQPLPTLCTCSPLQEVQQRCKLPAGVCVSSSRRHSTAALQVDRQVGQP